MADTANHASHEELHEEKQKREQELEAATRAAQLHSNKVHTGALPVPEEHGHERSHAAHLRADQEEPYTKPAGDIRRTMGTNPGARRQP